MQNENEFERPNYPADHPANDTGSHCRSRHDRTVQSAGCFVATRFRPDRRRHSRRRHWTGSCVTNHRDRSTNRDCHHAAYRFPRMSCRHLSNDENAHLIRKQTLRPPGLRKSCCSTRRVVAGCDPRCFGARSCHYRSSEKRRRPPPR